MGQASAIRSYLLAQGVSAVHALIGRSEDRQLDFKLKNDPRTPSLSEDDKKNLAKCISGFANSYGGLVVWGVKSERPSGINDAAEVATELIPLHRPEEFKQMLEQLGPQAVSPEVVEVSNDVILEGTGMGYVLTYVPVSYRGPHSANWPSRPEPGFPFPRYYRRLGDGNHPCDAHAIIEVLNRRLHPQVELTWHALRRTDDDQGHERYEISAYLNNLGPGPSSRVLPAFRAERTVHPTRLDPQAVKDLRRPAAELRQRQSVQC